MAPPSAGTTFYAAYAAQLSTGPDYVANVVLTDSTATGTGTAASLLNSAHRHLGSLSHRHDLGGSGAGPAGGHPGYVDEPTAGDPRYFWLNLRTAPQSAWSGEVHAEGSTATGDHASALEYRPATRAVSTEASLCDDFASPSDLWIPAITPLTGGLVLRVGADSAEPVGLCFDIRVVASSAGQSGSSYQGTRADLAWTFSIIQSDNS